jgi:biopolymer transport protein ExbD
MAEIAQGQGRAKGKNKRSRTSTKIDMTPMVDLAFLLITFFMLTTTFNKPQTMEINMPDKDDNQTTQFVPESRTITFILGKNDQVYWYMGDNTPDADVKQVDMRSTSAIRKVILENTKQVLEKTNKGMVVIIKALDNSKYQNLVDFLDEMHITNQTMYAIVDVYEADKALIAAKYPNSL